MIAAGLISAGLIALAGTLLLFADPGIVVGRAVKPDGSAYAAEELIVKAVCPSGKLACGVRNRRTGAFYLNLSPADPNAETVTIIFVHLATGKQCVHPQPIPTWAKTDLGKITVQFK